MKVIKGINFLYVPEVAKVLGISEPHTIKLIKLGKLKGVKVGKPFLVAEQNIDLFLKLADEPKENQTEEDRITE